MAYIWPKFYVPYISGSLVIAIRPEMEESFHMTAMLLLQKNITSIKLYVFPRSVTLHH
jgi:hypothetical protein